ncbi:MAG: regulatory iron-sulfur-containing complex subunit RicT [Planctomycetota bacterium]
MGKGKKELNVLVTARYGEMRYVADFICDVPNVKRGTKAVLATDRGTELGEILVINKEKPAEHRHRAEGERRSEYDKPGISGTVVRMATPDDISTAQKLHLNEEVQEYDFCASKIAALKLDMQLVCSEHILGGEKVIFYFLSENRVDFRDLVKDLSGQFKARIELRQIGARDSARLVGDYNSCGRQLCCQTFIKDFEPITMKMAKNQRTTLDPEKISGRCGKLKCCLKYENDVYLELRKLLPNIGAKVKTKKGDGEVADQNVIAQEFQLQLETGEWVKCWGSDVIEILTPGNADAPPKRRPRLPLPGAEDTKGKPGFRPRPAVAPAAGAPPAAGVPPAATVAPGAAPVAGAPAVPAAPRADRWPRKDKPSFQLLPAPPREEVTPGDASAKPPSESTAAPGSGMEEIEKSPSTQSHSRGAGSPGVMAPGQVDVDDIAAMLAKSPTAPPPSHSAPPLMPLSGERRPSQPPSQRRDSAPPVPGPRRPDRDRRDRGPRDSRDRRPSGPRPPEASPGARAGSAPPPAPVTGGAPAGPRPVDSADDRRIRRERREKEWRERVEKRILERQQRPASEPGSAPPAPPASDGSSPLPPTPSGAPPSGQRPPEHRGGVRGNRHRHRGGRGRGGSHGGPRPGGNPPPAGGPPAPPPPAP